MVYPKGFIIGNFQTSSFLLESFYLTNHWSKTLWANALFYWETFCVLLYFILKWLRTIVSLDKPSVCWCKALSSVVLLMVVYLLISIWKGKKIELIFRQLNKQSNSSLTISIDKVPAQKKKIKNQLASQLLKNV